VEFLWLGEEMLIWYTMTDPDSGLKAVGVVGTTDKYADAPSARACPLLDPLDTGAPTDTADTADSGGGDTADTADSGGGDTADTAGPGEPATTLGVHEASVPGMCGCACSWQGRVRAVDLLGWSWLGAFVFLRRRRRSA
jgi:hypothetical protein